MSHAHVPSMPPPRDHQPKPTSREYALAGVREALRRVGVAWDESTELQTLDVPYGDVHDALEAVIRLFDEQP